MLKKIEIYTLLPSFLERLPRSAHSVFKSQNFSTLVKNQFNKSVAHGKKLKIRKKFQDATRMGLKEFGFDDITSMAHDYLDEHREIREYYRKIAWELPRLSKFSIPFKPPEKYEILKFRYTTYLGDNHPADAKVTMEVLLKDLNLTPTERHKLIVIAGPRYNPLTDVLKFSCESFPYQIQNKKYLHEQLNKLIIEAKDSKDTFEDIPQDFRHVKSKPRLIFPKEWLKRE